MTVLRVLFLRLVNLFRRNRVEEELDQELQFHLRMEIDRLLKSGVDPESARHTATARFGGLEQTKESYRATSTLPVIESVLRDFRYAARSLRRQPSFTAITVFTLAVAIGANTAIFSLVNQALLHPRGVDDAERIISIREHYGKLLNLSDIGVTSGATFADVRDARDIFEHAAAMSNVHLTFTGGNKPEHLVGAQVSVEWFAVLGAKPFLGRTFVPEEDQPKSGRVAVLSYSTWTKIFGADHTVLDRTVELDLQRYRVIGVMKPDFDWLGPADVWIPLALAPSDVGPQERFHQHLFTLAKLRPNVSREKADAWLRLLTARVLASDVPGVKETVGLDWYVFSKSFADAIVGDTRTPMLLLLTAVGIVLLIATSNVAGLTLARNASRSHELAVQAALGASRGRLLSRVAAESLLLSGLGTALGLALALAGMRVVLLWVPKNAVPGLDAQFDAFTLGFTAAITTTASFFFGILPAWRSSALSSFGMMRVAGRTATSRQPLRSALVIVEAALALVLMVAAGALFKSFLRLEEVSPGFDTKGVMTAAVSFPPSQYATAEKQIAFYRAVLDRLPYGSSFASSIPFQGGIDTAAFEIQGRPLNDGTVRHGDVRLVSPGYFESLRIPLKKGRLFTVADQLGTERVVVIDENMARQYWPAEDPVGKQVRPNGFPAWFTIVGIVGHVMQADLAIDSGRGTLYYNLYQRRQRMPFAFVVARAPVDEIRNSVTIADSSESIFDVQTLEARVTSSLASRRFLLRIMSFFAATALFLSGLGLYGVISYAVNQRTREIGVRMALGARGANISNMVVGEGLRLTVIGAGLGLAASTGLARLLESQLFHVRTLDESIIFFSVSILVAVAIAASFFPARRAASVDPMSALRCD